MTPEEAFDAAMRHENRANPYPFFDELRKTPVVRVTNGIYAVTGYEELMALAHDPRVSSDLRKGHPQTARDRRIADESVVGMTPEIAGAYGQEPSFIAQDPPEHDRARRQCMRFFGPPDSPDLIPGLEPMCQRIVNELLDKATGKTRTDIVDEFAYPLPVNVICRIMGVPSKTSPSSTPDRDLAAASSITTPDIQTGEGQVRRAKGEASPAEFNQYLDGLVEKAANSSGPGCFRGWSLMTARTGGCRGSDVVSTAIVAVYRRPRDSTVNLISHCVLTVLRHRVVRRLLRSRPEHPRAIEEVLRLRVVGAVLPNSSPWPTLTSPAPRSQAARPSC